MSCGEYGPGRMAEPLEIVSAIEEVFRGEAKTKPLAGRKALITAGPTHEPIDPVRYIANRSSGKQGYAIARALSALGAEVHLISGPAHLPDPDGINTVRVETAHEMLEACEAVLPADIGVFTAAVADWRVAMGADQKIKKTPNGGPPPLNLAENPDILATVAQRAQNRPALVIGFAAETEHVVEHAKAKRARKGCDWLVANDVSTAAGVMGGDFNTVHLIRETGVEDWPRATKQEVADRLAQLIAAHFGTGATP